MSRDKNGFNAIITGIPRSGTTLTCHLLNKLPNIVALHEPMSHSDWLAGHTQSIDELVDDFFESSRKSLLERKTAISKQYQGQIPDNPKSRDSFSSKVLNRFNISRIDLEKLHMGDLGLRQGMVEHGQVRFDKPLSADFTLCIKHNGQFTSLLPSLIERYKVCAVIRNPLAVLCSWNSINFGPRDGHMYAAEKFNPELADRLASIGDRYQRQLTLLSWFYEQYEQWLEPEQVICYEDLVSSNGRALSSIVKQAESLNEALSSNNGAYGDRKLNQMLAQLLLESTGDYWQFYSRQSVTELATQLSKS